MRAPRKLAFVIPWYSDAIGGGAESACQSLAKTLQQHGAEVEILTTRVKDFRSDWNQNFYPEGPAVEGGVPVRRFSVRQRDESLFNRVNASLMHGRTVSAEEEEIFLREMINSPALNEYIGKHRDQYVFLFLPYLFGTTYWGSRACQGSAVLIPCLHDEGYARMERIGGMFREAAGVIFLSNGERELAQRLYGPVPDLGVLGLPLDCRWTADAERFRNRHGLRDFLLYAGRIDQGKGADVLVDYFGRYVEQAGDDLHLAFLGVEEVPFPEKLRGRIHVLGFVPEQEKRDAMAAALALCVPSLMESFSIVLMESWLAGRPVIVNERCAVTTGFCRESNAGLWFADCEEFHETVRFLRSHPGEAEAMGRNGAAYVRRHFEPETVARKYLEALGPMISPP